jgi:hypothetical protein
MRSEGARDARALSPAEVEMAKSTVRDTSGEDADAVAVEAIARAVEGLRYGQVEIQVHDARVVRIMRTEKIRVYEECTNKTT